MPLEQSAGSAINSMVNPDAKKSILDDHPVGQQTNGVDNSHDGQKEDISFNLGDFSIDEYRPMKVIIIGAGFSGITAGIR